MSPPRRRDTRLDLLLQARRRSATRASTRARRATAGASSQWREREGSLAIEVATGDTLWTYRTGALTYGTPSVADGRVFVADLSGNVAALAHSDGTRFWLAHVPGRVLAPDARRRQPRLLLDATHARPDRAGDPLDGLVNLFDLAIVLSVAFLLAALASLKRDEPAGASRTSRSWRVRRTARRPSSRSTATM